MYLGLKWRNRVENTPPPLHKTLTYIKKSTLRIDYFTPSIFSPPANCSCLNFKIHLSMITVMMCDDDVALMEGVSSFLKRFKKINVIEKVNSGDACIQLIESGVIPDILLLDIRMPNGISGYDVAKFILQKPYPIKIIVLSVLDDLNAVKAMMRLGVKGYVFKADSLKDYEFIFQSIYEGKEYYSKILNFTLAQIEEIKNTPIAWLENMHPQEMKVLELIANDKSQKEVSKALAISSSLIAKRLRSLGQKTGAQKSSIGLINFFKSVGLIK